ncbi:hypothetical protein [Streptomyces sp. T028]|uniref:DprA-like winged helix domain-containing protein n=1 Tax=Streptomyces sp. T028 TaxID=3394379 RepID=UPI003A8A876E
MGVRSMTSHAQNTPPESEPPSPQALRALYESGATVDELVADSGLSYGTVLRGRYVSA